MSLLVVHAKGFIKGAHYLELQRAYDVLSDDQKRAQYDRWLEGGAIVSFDTWMTLQSTHSVSHRCYCTYHGHI